MLSFQQNPLSGTRSQGHHHHDKEKPTDQRGYCRHPTQLTHHPVHCERPLHPSSPSLPGPTQRRAAGPSAAAAAVRSPRLTPRDRSSGRAAPGGRSPYASRAGGRVGRAHSGVAGYSAEHCGGGAMYRSRLSCSAILVTTKVTGH